GKGVTACGRCEGGRDVGPGVAVDLPRVAECGTGDIEPAEQYCPAPPEVEDHRVVPARWGRGGEHALRPDRAVELPGVAVLLVAIAAEQHRAAASAVVRERVLRPAGQQRFMPDLRPGGGDGAQRAGRARALALAPAAAGGGWGAGGGRARSCPPAAERAPPPAAEGPRPRPRPPRHSSPRCPRTVRSVFIFDAPSNRD